MQNLGFKLGEKSIDSAGFSMSLLQNHCLEIIDNEKTEIEVRRMR